MSPLFTAAILWVIFVIVIGILYQEIEDVKFHLKLINYSGRRSESSTIKKWGPYMTETKEHPKMFYGKGRKLNE